MGGARKRKAPLIEDCAVVPLPQDGDCFYKCIARAYASAGLSASDEANEIMLNDKENEVKRLRRCLFWWEVGDLPTGTFNGREKAEYPGRAL